MLCCLTGENLVRCAILRRSTRAHCHCSLQLHWDGRPSSFRYFHMHLSHHVPQMSLNGPSSVPQVHMHHPSPPLYTTSGFWRWRKAPPPALMTVNVLFASNSSISIEYTNYNCTCVLCLHVVMWTMHVLHPDSFYPHLRFPMYVTIFVTSCNKVVTNSFRGC